MISQATRDAICEQLADGRSLRDVLRQDGMPAMSHFFNELKGDIAFQEQYARAKEAGIEALAADTLYIANTPQMGVIRTVKPDGSEEVKHADMIEHRRLQVDTRKWLLSKLAPKKYGDKLDVTQAGELSLVHKIERVIVDPRADPDS